jgi:hypothetical protein
MLRITLRGLKEIGCHNGHRYVNFGHWIHAASLTSTAVASPADVDLHRILAEREGDDLEAGYHIPLFTLAAFLGLLAAISGITNSSNKRLCRLVPFAIPRKFHRWVSVAFYAVFLFTFVVWAIQYRSAEGELFHTGHGIVSLLTLIGAILSIATGAAMCRRPKKWKEVHLVLSNITYVLLLITIFLEMTLDD